MVGAVELVDRHVARETPPACLFKLATGKPCPTCGTTRMVLAVIHGQWRQAVGHNPLMFGLLCLGIALLALRVVFSRRFVVIASPRSRRFAALAAVVAVLANWVYVLRIG
jgi:hypothetical protein